jgi:beta-galactosidase
MLKSVLRAAVPALLALCPALAVAQPAAPAHPTPQAHSASATQPAPVAATAPLPDGKPHTLRAADGQFQLDGKPVRLISGEMHYPRIPREYWRARLRMARAMGLNAITTYTFWNVHEPTPGTYDFAGQNDVAEFVREAQQEGLWVILRPGPYVCAEWEFGGYPAWLLKDPTTVVRSQDPRFLVPATRWLKRLGQELAPLQAANGGPIVLVQVENEYGSFGNDHVYMDLNRKALLDAGFTSTQLYTADGPAEIANGSIPDLPVGINFDGNHPGSAEKAFATLKKTRPDSPPFNSEFWAGWFDHWGSPHAHTDTKAQADNLAWMLQRGYSVSIYMFHGGTDFGWMNGANSSDTKKDYQPDVTSYDYDSALDESGRPTPKFFAFRKVIAQALGCPIPDTASALQKPSCLPALPESTPPIAIPSTTLTESASLWDNLPTPIESPTPLTMEDVGQNYGYILYRTRLSEGTGSLSVHDYARTYLDGEDDPSSTADRRLHGNISFETRVDRTDDGTSQLDILVENMGRINYSHQLLHERKGIVAWTPPTGGPHPPKSWSIYPLPFTGSTDPARFQYKKAGCTGPCFYRGHFTVPHPADTFLDTSTLGKGQLWINGHALGRFWSIGPQKTLYVPGPWLNSGTNDIIVFDLDGKPNPTVQGLTRPNLGQTTAPTDTGNP